MRSTVSLIFLLLSSLTWSAVATNDISTAAELERIVFVLGETNRTFHLTATATSLCNPPHRMTLYLEDASGETSLYLGYLGETPYIRPGDVVEASGFTADDGNVHAQCRKLKTIGRSGLKEAPRVTSADIRSGRHFRRRVRVEGVVRDVFSDEIDPNMLFVLLGDGTGLACATFDTRLTDIATVRRLLGDTVSITGICTSHNNSPRSGRSYMLAANSHDNAIRTGPETRDPFDAPLLDTIATTTLDKFLCHGRHRTQGRVIAAWGDNRLLLENAARKPVCLKLLDAPDTLPVCGDFIEASGLPETDMFKVNLSHAVFRHLPEPRNTNRTDPVQTTIAQLTRDRDGRRKINLDFDGHVVQVRGHVVNVSASEHQIYLSDNGAVLRADVSAFPEILEKTGPGCDVAVTGTFVLLTEDWNSDVTFPRISDCLLVPWSVADIVVVRRPSWWTPARLFALLGAVSLILVAIVIWNLLLRRLVDRRGRELAAETVARTESELKVYERTRLATELHDSLAQILTGIAFKLETVDRLAETNPTAMRSHLGIAIRSLQACRDDLRNCLWDLRNHALEIPDMDKAIRRTLEQHLEGTELLVRFNISRELLSDNTTHEILCIIRELVLNAIRHGHATEVRVAGAIEDETLRFSVSDNGCGFDPDNCPGMREGHYGLQGVRERAAHLDGEFTIRTNGTSGMKAVVSIKIPHTT